MPSYWLAGRCRRIFKRAREKLARVRSIDFSGTFLPFTLKNGNQHVIEWNICVCLLLFARTRNTLALIKFAASSEAKRWGKRWEEVQVFSARRSSPTRALSYENVLQAAIEWFFFYSEIKDSFYAERGTLFYFYSPMKLGVFSVCVWVVCLFEWELFAIAETVGVFHHFGPAFRVCFSAALEFAIRTPSVFRSLVRTDKWKQKRKNKVRSGRQVRIGNVRRKDKTWLLGGERKLEKIRGNKDKRKSRRRELSHSRGATFRGDFGRFPCSFAAAKSASLQIINWIWQNAKRKEETKNSNKERA